MIDLKDLFQFAGVFIYKTQIYGKVQVYNMFFQKNLYTQTETRQATDIVTFIPTGTLCFIASEQTLNMGLILPLLFSKTVAVNVDIYHSSISLWDMLTFKV